MSRNKTYYHIDERPQRKRSKAKLIFGFMAVFVALVGGFYVFALTQSPEVIANSTDSAKAKEQQLVSGNQDFIKIARLNLLVPFNTGDTEATLQGGAWWRYPENGNPEDGGDFMLCAHRFKLGTTPGQTKEQSPFYHIGKVEEDETIDIYYKGQWYSYRVTEKKNALPGTTDVEDSSKEAKLVLYTCTSDGSADGRVVLMAVPVVSANSLSSEGNEDPESGGNLLL